jgi:hypothetical protein
MTPQRAAARVGTDRVLQKPLLLAYHSDANASGSREPFLVRTMLVVSTVLPLRQLLLALIRKTVKRPELVSTATVLGFHRFIWGCLASQMTFLFITYKTMDV